MSSNNAAKAFWKLWFVSAAAIAFAVAVALWSVGSARAGAVSYYANKYCDCSWDARAEFAGSAEPVLIALTDVKVNGLTYEPGWSLMGGMTGSSLPPIEGFTAGRPGPGTYYWRGSSAGGPGAGVLFHRSGAMVAASGWAGVIRVYRFVPIAPFSSIGVWTPDGPAVSVTPPVSSPRCITVKKVVTNVTNDFTVFSGSVRSSYVTWRFSGLRETSTGLVWAPTFYGDFTVNEDPADGYVNLGYLVVRGVRANCPASPAKAELSLTPPAVTLSPSMPNVTICIYNQQKH